jgi:hypothetical protein
MAHSILVTENQLDNWVHGNAEHAQGLAVELILRLVAASCPGAKRRFPLPDSIGQTGPDGELDVETPFEHFVPEGHSYWEIGTSSRAGAKATSDYRDATTATPEAVRQSSTFIFVTPLSARQDWPYTWKEGAQQSWLETRRKRQEWRDIRVIDGTILIDWLHHFPAVEIWLAHVMGWPTEQIETPEQRWSVLRTIGEPPPLTPEVFLANREAACAKLNGVFAGEAIQLKLETRHPEQMTNFVCAYIANMNEDSRIGALGRCLVISGIDAWNAICVQRERHILVADFDLDQGANSTRLLEKARRAGHAVIYGGRPGGIPHPNCVAIPNPKSHQVKQALETAGYGEERARMFAQRSAGNLTSLLRCLQNASLMPEWAERTSAAELAIALFLGSWNEGADSDRTVAEEMSGKVYGEWIGTMREIVQRPGTPLTQSGGVWRFVVRYEGWYALGPRLFDEHLDRLRKAAVGVLRERDPKFDLPAEQRLAASIYEKVLAHSTVLRNGLAETLALLGSHPKALTSCSSNKAEATAVLAVREILADADWVQWASLGDVLPLLAEAAPKEFLDAVETALNSDPCPFDGVFAQESTGVTGANYATGLLWALETLAWDAEYLTRVVILLGELAARDPGGNWANRPADSITTILLPWRPQTCAPLAKRLATVKTLLNELPDVAWDLLWDLLPQTQQFSIGSRKPAWREMISDDYTEGVTRSDYRKQVDAYAEMAIHVAQSDPAKLPQLVEHLGNLPPTAQGQLLGYLESDAVMTMPETDRVRIWTELLDLASKHRKFAGAEWALKPEQVDRIAAVAARLAPDAPALRHQRLFGNRDHDLFEERGNYAAQAQELAERRETAVKEVSATRGVQAVLGFASSVESPLRVGIAFGAVAGSDADNTILPDLLETEQKALLQFSGGFVLGRFRSHGWLWVDALDTTKWTPAQVGQFLSYLPFTSDTWVRLAPLLGNDETPYWTRTPANPHEATTGLELAADRLIENGRPFAALRCLQRMQEEKQPFDSARAIRALLAATNSPEGAQAMDTYDIVEIIRVLQDAPGTNPDDLFRVEWLYLPLLDKDQQASPKLLERRLANEPTYFCEIIRLAFRSRKKAEHPTEESTEQTKNMAKNAHHLLSKWRTPPGSREDGTYDGNALTIWLDAVKGECAETGHLEVAMTMVGQVLIHAPADPDGLWIHRAAAAVLDAKDAGDMRTGFHTELFNSRGVYWSSGGQEERGFAAKYRSQAEAVELAGFHRLASEIRALAASYERDAERQAARDPSEE